MDVYRTDRIRNVVLLGHGGSGKTTLVEAMAYLSGITNRLGKVADGNTISDFDKEEIKRKFSISASIVPIEWGKVKINVLDTPGLFDFVGRLRKPPPPRTLPLSLFPGRPAYRWEPRRPGLSARDTIFPE